MKKETKITSYVITNLYNNIDIKTIDIIKTSSNIQMQQTTGKLIKTVENILNQNYLLFNNKIYKQEEGCEWGMEKASECVISQFVPFTQYSQDG